MQSKCDIKIDKEPWGNQVSLFHLRNDILEITLSDYGARLIRVKAPNRKGHREDVVLGFDTVEEYVRDSTYMGATVGRFANRIANGSFLLDGEIYHVTRPVGMKYALHGGAEGFDRRVWRTQLLPDGVRMQLISSDGDMGFPGTLEVQICYQLHGEALHIVFEAITDKTTIINLTNHAYFNLKGDDRGDILSHKAAIFAGSFTPVNEETIPTGEIKSVLGTALDLRHLTTIVERIAADDEQIRLGEGFNHNFVLNGEGIKDAAEVYEPISGRTLSVATSQPGVQFYTGNALDGMRGRHGRPYGSHAGFCLETQHFPDSPHHPHFPSTVLVPGEQFSSNTIYRFGSR